MLCSVVVVVSFVAIHAVFLAVSMEPGRWEEAWAGVRHRITSVERYRKSVVECFRRGPYPAVQPEFNRGVQETVRIIIMVPTRCHRPSVVVGTMVADHWQRSMRRHLEEECSGDRAMPRRPPVY